MALQNLWTFPTDEQSNPITVRPGWRATPKRRNSPTASQTLRSLYTPPNHPLRSPEGEEKPTQPLLHLRAESEARYNTDNSGGIWLHSSLSLDQWHSPSGIISLRRVSSHSPPPASSLTNVHNLSKINNNKIGDERRGFGPVRFSTRLPF